MIKLRNVEFREFLELVEFLTLTEKTTDEEGRIFGITMKLSRFFPKLTALDSIQLGNLVESIYKKSDSSEQLFESMGDFDFDPEGRNEINLSYDSVPEESINILLDNAREMISHEGKDSSRHRVNTQIINAFELKCLDTIKASPNYNIHKVKYYLLVKDKHSRVISREEFEKYENICEWLVGKNNNIMDKIISYIENKKEENFKVFLRHFLMRLELAHEDYNFEHENNKIFVENLKRIAK